MEHEETGDENHGPADDAPGRFEDERDQNAAHDQVIGRLFAVPHVKRVDVPDRPELNKQDQTNEGQVDAEAQRPQTIARIAVNPNRVVHGAAKKRLHEDGERQHDSQVDGPE